MDSIHLLLLPSIQLAAMTSVRRSLFCIVFAPWLLACVHTCPEIGCASRIDMTFESPLSSNYSLALSIRGESLSANCPLTSSGLSRTPRIDSCNASGFTVTGVDLGHGENDKVAFTVAIDGGAPAQASASLKGIENSRDCSYVCFIHEGHVTN
jgi:hypothetical protein